MEMTFQQKLEIFQISCSVYLQEKKIVEEIRNSSPELDPLKKQFNDYTFQDVAYVESSFRRIGKRCGTNARLVTWLLFVEGQTQTSVAEECHISRRQLQYSMDKWMHDFLEEGEKDMSENDRLSAFHSSCRMYEAEKNKLESMKDVVNKGIQVKTQIQLIQEDVNFTESVFSQIEAKFGKEAKDIAVLLFVNGKRQTDVAEQYQMTRRQLQYSVNKWLKETVTA